MTDGVLVVEAESAERAVTVAGDARDVQVLVVNSQRVVSVSPGIRTPAAAVARILATPHTFSLTPGETQALTVVTKDVDGATLTGRAITYESADPSIATVDEDGLVTGVGAGVIAIIVRCEGETTAVVVTGLAAWTPSAVAGLACWLRADAGVSLNGENVAAWADQSGNGTDATQGTESKQPLLVLDGMNGLPVVRFDGATNFLRWALSLPAPYTVGVVFRLRVVPVELGEGGSMLRFKDAGSKFHEVAALHYAGYAPMEVSGDVSQAAGASASIGFEPTLDTLPHTLVYSYVGGGKSDPTKYNVRLDAEVQSLAPSGLFGATASNVASLGARSDDSNVGSLFGMYDLAEIAIYSAELVTADQQHLEAYLTRWLA